MTDEQQLFDDTPVSKYEYDNAVVLAADVGVAEDATVDVVDGTVIVVVGDEQCDFKIPGDDAQAFIRNGVLTVEMTTEVSK
jgi:hypothetical protein